MDNIILEITSGFVGLQGEGIDEGIEKALASLGHYCKADRVYLFLYRDQYTRVDNTHEWCDEGISRGIEYLQDICAPKELPWVHEAILASEVLNIQDVSQLPARAHLEKKILEAQNIKSLLLVPVSINQEILGFLGFDSVKEKRKWNGHEINLLKILAGNIGLLISRKRFESRLCESEEKFRTLADTSPLAIYMSSGIEQTAEYINPTFVKLFGYTMDEVPTVAEWYPLAYPDEDYRNSLVNEWQIKVEQAIETNSAIESMETVVTCKDGSTKTILWGFSAVGKQNWSLGLDLTDRKQAEGKRIKLESRLRQSQKMEAIGTMAGGIAHDFNNLLAIIGGNLDLLQFKQQAEKPIDENLDHIREATSRAKNLVAQILAFSRQEHKDLVPVNLSTLVGESFKFLRPMIPTTVEVVTVVPEDNIFINADTTQLQQVLINLCTNALHAMNEKGLLRISLEEGELTSKEALLTVEPLASRYAKLSVADTGKGMNKKTLDQIFDPFFTTKEVGSGTGMGLSMVHGIIIQHGGFIHVDSTLGQGSTFTLYFPVTSDVEPTEEQDVETNLPTGTEYILFVDDEQYVADVCGSMLGHLGYKVSIITNSVEALDLFKAHPDEFDLVITDQTMPKMSGVELAKELLKVKPDLPIILCSGYSAQVTDDDALEIGIRAFCMKPLGMKQLATVTRETLDTSKYSSITR